MDISIIESELIAPSCKGAAATAVGTPMRDLGRLGLNVLAGDLPLPAAVLKEAALANNLAWMRVLTERLGVSLAPHGKTTMAPQLLHRHLQEGAWAITAATAAHVRTYRQFGVPRIFMANQLVGEANIRLVLDELHADPGFDFYCLVDSIVGLRLLQSALLRHPLSRPLQVLLEVGAPRRRSGVRDLGQGAELGRALRDAAPQIALRGIETYEDVQPASDAATAESGVRQMFEDSLQLLRQGVAENWFAPGELIVSAGGSSYYDLAAQALKQASAPQPVRVVIRSGCYLTHDSLYYADKQARIFARSPDLCVGTGLQNALEVWAFVQSVPEKTMAVCGLGKRDVSYDIALPQPLHWFRPGLHAAPVPAPETLRVVRLFDQHAIVDSGTGEIPWQVGDCVGFGVAHPCTTFDKWSMLHVVDDRYTVLGGIRTLF